MNQKIHEFEADIKNQDIGGILHPGGGEMEAEVAANILRDLDIEYYYDDLTDDQKSEVIARITNEFWNKYSKNAGETKDE